MSNMPVEIERKFLIEYPNLEILKGMKNYEVTYIEQTYLKAADLNGGYRVRKRGLHGTYEYTKTYKQDITALKRIELEDKIEKEEYEELLKRADKEMKTIRKYRHCFEYKNKLLELDIYPFWEDRATLEIELESEEEEVEIPEFIKVIKEVTRDFRYRNRSLSRDIITEIF